MFQSFIEGMLGPSGMKVLHWYIANSLYINGAIVIIALLYIMFPSHGKRLSDFLRQLYLKSPLAPDEKDRQAIERMKSLYKSKKSRRHRE